MLGTAVDGASDAYGGSYVDVASLPTAIGPPSGSGADGFVAKFSSAHVEPQSLIYLRYLAGGDYDDRAGSAASLIVRHT
jgi:hypothetical protein